MTVQSIFLRFLNTSLSTLQRSLEAHTVAQPYTPPKKSKRRLEFEVFGYAHNQVVLLSIQKIDTTDYDVHR